MATCAPGLLGRESYTFDPGDPRFVTEMLSAPLDRGSPAFGGNLLEARTPTSAMPIRPARWIT